MSISARQVRLAARPRGLPTADDFRIAEAATSDPEPGEAQVRTLVMSVDPYMRPRLDQAQALDAPLAGGGIGQVAKVRGGRLKEGDLVRHEAGFQEIFNAPVARLSPLRRDPDLPLTVYLHALGAPGLTAYGGLLEVARLAGGEQVFVSAAAGAVGSVAAQIARLKGCYVVGSAGAADKVRWLLDEAALDAAVNYRARPIAEALAEVTPNGLDVYFDNVGGDHLDAALARMNLRGRVAVCGMIAAYNGEPAPVRALPAIIYGRLTLQGFVTTDFQSLAPAFAADMTGWLKDGSIAYQETVLEGIERTPEALIGLFTGANRGKMLVRVAD